MGLNSENIVEAESIEKEKMIRSHHWVEIARTPDLRNRCGVLLIYEFTSYSKLDFFQGFFDAFASDLGP